LKRSNRLILLIGVFLAVVAFVLIIILLSGNPTTRTDQNATPPPVPTVIAAQDIPLGATITEEMLTSQNLAQRDRLPGAFSSASQVVGPDGPHRSDEGRSDHFGDIQPEHV
jgi:Flp pilus assembly protein CpaB